MAALQYLKSYWNTHPELHDEWYDLLADLYQKELWHQFYRTLSDFIAPFLLKDGDARIQLYHNVIAGLENKVDPLDVAQHAVQVSRRYSEYEEAIGFLEGVMERLQASEGQRVDQTMVFLKMEIARFKLSKGDPEECKKLLEDGKGALDSMTDIDPSVYALYYLVSSEYLDCRGEFSELYKSALLHVEYTWSFDPPDSFKQEWAYKLGIAALVGDNIYNIGELLAHPIIKSLSGTDEEWLYHILKAIDRGDVSGYQELWQKYDNAIKDEAVLVENEARLREKVNILCLMEVIFSEPIGARTIPLNVIADHTGLPLERVEHLLIKSFSVLIQGTIDRVEGTMHVSWLQPTVPETHQLESLEERINGRKDKAMSSI